MRRWTPFGLVFLHLVGGAISRAQVDTELHQPTRSPSNLVLETALGAATVDRNGAQPRRIPVRRNELLTTIAETRGGWTAAGIKQVRHGSELILVSRGSTGTKRLSSPSAQRHDLRLRPTLLIGDDTMRGLAWLEGPDVTSLSVRTSGRVDDAWDDVVVVAPPAKGSQTGLVGAELVNGSWLLVWSAFDGQDDDLLWSHGRNGGWSAARRVGPNNSTPDVTPTLVTTADGALLAWSRMIDGHYQIMMARFDGSTWSSPSLIGPQGSLEPTFAVREGRLHLLYRHAWPSAWAVADLTPEGRMDRIAILAEDHATRPVVVGSSSREVELRWPGRGRQSHPWEVIP